MANRQPDHLADTVRELLGAYGWAAVIRTLSYKLPSVGPGRANHALFTALDEAADIAEDSPPEKAGDAS
jgi:hypothetical protein